MAKFSFSVRDRSRTFREALALTGQKSYGDARERLRGVEDDPASWPWEASYLMAWLLAFGHPEADRDGDESPPDDQLWGLDGRRRAMAGVTEAELGRARALLEHAARASRFGSYWVVSLLADVHGQSGDALGEARFRFVACGLRAVNGHDLNGCLEAYGRALEAFDDLPEGDVARWQEELVEAVRGAQVPREVVADLEAEAHIAAARRYSVLGDMERAGEQFRLAEAASPDAVDALQLEGRPAAGTAVADAPPADPLGGADVEGSFVGRVFELFDTLLRPRHGRSEQAGAGAVLLFGPSGTGKTHAVRSYAARRGHDFAFRKTRLDQIHGRYVGDSEKGISEFLETVRRSKGGGIAFIDEVDTIGSMRDEDGSQWWHSSFVGHLLTEIDRFKETANGAIVVGATNRIWALDYAFIRRFDHVLLTPLPQPAERRDVFAVLLADADVPVTDAQLDALVAASGAMTPADCASAVRFALRQGRDDLDAIVELVLGYLDERRHSNHLQKWISLSRDKLRTEGFDDLLLELDESYGAVAAAAARSSAEAGASANGQHVIEILSAAHLGHVSRQIR